MILQKEELTSILKDSFKRAKSIEDLAGDLLDRGFTVYTGTYEVALPCKIGDKVWCIRNYKSKPVVSAGLVSEMFYVAGDMTLCIVVHGICRGRWGETVFATKDAAERAIKKGGSECA